MGSEPRVYGVPVDYLPGAFYGGCLLNEKQCREIVFARAGGRCEVSGVTHGLSYHHRKKRSHGGKWSPENIVLVAGSGTTGIHGWIEANPNEAEARGLHVRPWQSPEDIPVRTFHSGLVYLFPDGSVCERRRDEEEATLATESRGVSEGCSGRGEREVEDDNPGAPEVPASG